MKVIFRPYSSPFGRDYLDSLKPLYFRRVIWNPMPTVWLRVCSTGASRKYSKESTYVPHISTWTNNAIPSTYHRSEGLSEHNNSNTQALGHEYFTHR